MVCKTFLRPPKKRRAKCAQDVRKKWGSEQKVRKMCAECAQNVRNKFCGITSKNMQKHKINAPKKQISGQNRLLFWKLCNNQHNNLVFNVLSYFTTYIGN